MDLGGGIIPTVLNTSDTVTFRYYGHDNPDTVTPPGTADGSVVDCQGNSVRRDDMLTETLYVAADATNNNEPTLFCGSVLVPFTGATTRVQVPLIPGVESLQLLYGEDTDGDGVINRYVPIQSVSDLGAIKAIWVSVVIRAPGSSAPAAQSLVFNHFGVTYAPGTFGTSSAALVGVPAAKQFRMTVQSLAGAVTLANYSYTLAPAGNRTGIAESGTAINSTAPTTIRNVNYGYDHLYRLKSETISGACPRGRADALRGRRWRRRRSRCDDG